MTAREWIEKNRPDRIFTNCCGDIMGCPHEYDALRLSRPEYCIRSGDDTICKLCWDREIPGTEEVEVHRNATARCEKCIHGEVCKFRADLANASIVANEALVDDNVRAIDLPFVHAIEVHCKYYVKGEKK